MKEREKKRSRNSLIFSSVSPWHNFICCTVANSIILLLFHGKPIGCICNVQNHGTTLTTYLYPNKFSLHHQIIINSPLRVKTTCYLEMKCYAWLNRPRSFTLSISYFSSDFNGVQVIHYMQTFSAFLRLHLGMETRDSVKL